jgi:hypothetical protein
MHRAATAIGSLFEAAQVFQIIEIVEASFP